MSSIAYVCSLYATPIRFFCFHECGVHVGDVDAKDQTLDIASGKEITKEKVSASLLRKLADEKNARMSSFIVAHFKFYKEPHFAYLDISPLNTGETDTHAKTIVSLMTRYKHPDGKFLIVGSCIANKTDVEATFTRLNWS